MEEYTEELYNTILNDLDNHHDVVFHSEPDILECEVKWASGSTAAYKATRGDGIPAELFKTLEDLNCCTQYVSKFGKSISGHRTGKKSILIPIPKKGSTKEYSIHQTIALISHATNVMLKILQAMFQHHVNWELPDVKAAFRKGRGPRDQIANTGWIIGKAREF